MGRPFAVVGFAYFSALAVALFIGTEPCGILFIILTLLLFAAVMCLKRSHKRKISALCTALVSAMAALLVFSMNYSSRIEPALALDGEEYITTAVLSGLPYSQNGRYYYTLSTEDIEDCNSAVKPSVLASSSVPLSIDPGDRIRAKIKYHTPDPYSRSSLLSDGIVLTGTIESAYLPRIEKSREHDIGSSILMLRQSVGNTIDTLLPAKEAAFVRALIIADKTDIDESVAENLRSSGLMHLVSVSGFHVSLLCGLVIFIVGFSMFRRRISAFLCIGVIALYLAMTGFTPSALRAGIMQLVYMLSLLVFRESDSINSLGLSVLIICCIEPFSPADIGFFLSVSATLGIVLCADKMYTYLAEHAVPAAQRKRRLSKGLLMLREKIISYVLMTISVSLCANIFTLPIMLFYFRGIQIYFFLSNLLVGFMMPLLMLSAILMLCFAGVAALATPLAAICVLAVDYILSSAHLVASLPFSTISLSQNYIPVWAVGCIVLLIPVLRFKKRGRALRLYSAFCVVALAVVTGVSMIIKHDSVKLSVIDCGVGMSAVLKDGSHTAVLYCGGSYDGYDSIVRYLQKQDTQNVSLLLLADSRERDTGFADIILKKYTVDNTLIYDSEHIYSDTKALAEKYSNAVYAESSEGLDFYGTKITVYRQGTGSAVMLSIYGENILLCSDGFDVGELSGYDDSIYRTVINGKIKNADKINTGGFIISDEKAAVQSYDNIFEINENVYATGGSGNLALRVYKNGEIIQGRERAWLS